MTSSIAMRRVKAAAVVTAAAVALGVAAPLAEATEAKNSVPAATLSVPQTGLQAVAPAASDPAFTADEVRDLIRRMRADGGADTAEIAQFESYADRLEGKAPTKPMPGFGWSTIVRKLVVAGFRHGGVWLSKVLKRVSPKAAKYAGRYGNRIADAIDAVESWGEHALTIALVRAGVPTDVASDLAKAIIIIAA